MDKEKTGYGKCKELAHKYGQSLSDAQYLAFTTALNELKDFIVEKSANWIAKESASSMAEENKNDYMVYILSELMKNKI